MTTPCPFVIDGTHLAAVILGGGFVLAWGMLHEWMVNRLNRRQGHS